MLGQRLVKMSGPLVPSNHQNLARETSLPSDAGLKIYSLAGGLGKSGMAAQISCQWQSKPISYKHIYTRARTLPKLSLIQGQHVMPHGPAQAAVTKHQRLRGLYKHDGNVLPQFWRVKSPRPGSQAWTVSGEPVNCYSSTVNLTHWESWEALWVPFIGTRIPSWGLPSWPKHFPKGSPLMSSYKD